MKKGVIVKLIGGQYTVKDADSKYHVCKPRGKFRHIEFAPKVGDYVHFENQTITEVTPRNNELTRPPIANIDQAVLIHAAAEPVFSFNLLDRFLVSIEAAEITPVIIVSKIDLIDEKNLKILKEKLAYYARYYDVYYTSVSIPESLDSLKSLFKDKTSVFAGQTGSGKSSLLNALDINLNLETGEISKALGRGRHTTRHSELLEVHEGLVADTPGFSKLDFVNIEADNLTPLYPDFVAYSPTCKFRACIHISEPQCGVKKALEDGKILKERYDNYRLIYEEIKSQKKKY